MTSTSVSTFSLIRVAVALNTRETGALTERERGRGGGGGVKGAPSASIDTSSLVTEGTTDVK